MFGIFGKQLKKLTSVWNKAEHTSLAKAVVAAGVYVAAADGNIAEDEIETLKGIIANKESLKVFQPESSQWVDDNALLISRSAYTGKLELLRQIAAVKSDKAEAENVLMVTLDVAFADGEMSDKEKAAVEKVAETLGLRLGDYL